MHAADELLTDDTIVEDLASPGEGKAETAATEVDSGDDLAALRVADRLFRRADRPTKDALVDAFGRGILRLGNRAPRTKGEHALFRLAQRRRDLRARRRLLERHLAACEQALSIDPHDHDLERSRYELEGRLARVKREHAQLTRKRNALELQLLRGRLERGDSTLPPRYDLRIRRERKRQDILGAADSS